MRISQFGVFLALDGGISGLIHLSEISSEASKNIEEHIKVGENVKAKIITFDAQAKRIGLSMKALEAGAEAPAATEEAPKKKASKKKEETAEEAEAPAAE
jgi:general stress protein 13